MTLPKDSLANAAAGSGTGPADNKGSQVTLEQVGETVATKLAELGLKDGQRFDTMVTGAAKRATFEALGVPVGVKPEEHLTNMFKTAATDLLVKNADTVKPPDDKPVDPVVEMKAQYSEVKDGLNKLTVENESLKAQAAEDKRRGLVRDALGEYKIRPDVSRFVTHAMLDGWDGVKPTVNPDDGSLYVTSVEGEPVAFNSYLDGYFKENAGLLDASALAGSGSGRGIVGGKPAGATTPVKLTRSDSREAAAQWKQDLDGTKQVVDKQISDLSSGIYF